MNKYALFVMVTLCFLTAAITGAAEPLPGHAAPELRVAAAGQTNDTFDPFAEDSENSATPVAAIADPLEGFRPRKDLKVTDSSDIPATPPHLGDAGADFWLKVVTEYTFAPPELEILLRAGEVVDSLTILQDVIDREGHVVEGKVHPALVERRLQGNLLSKYVAGLRIPDPHAVQGASQRRGPRGVYQPRTS